MAAALMNDRLTWVLSTANRWMMVGSLVVLIHLEPFQSETSSNKRYRESGSIRWLIRLEMVIGGMK